MIDIDFKFRAVGQGAFYSGRFRHQNGQQFSMVYDCGTHSSRQYIDREIRNFVRETRKEKIDILFISHFHEDHINKIAALLNQTGGAKLAILPYLSPDELILAYADASLSEGGPDPDTLAFIQNPTAFLLDRKVDRIIYIHPGDDGKSGENTGLDDKEVNPESPDFRFVLSNQLMPNNAIIEQNIGVQHYYDTGNFSIIGFWEFKFFNKPRNLATVTAFVSDVKNLLGKTNISFNDLADYITANPRSFESDFNSIYSINFGYRQLVNETSLVIYHGALDAINPYPRIYRRWMRNNCTGTLLTGDIIFDQNCYDEIIRKWVNPKYQINVGIFQVPHHGANNYLLTTLTSRYPHVMFWVINFGLGNTHKHPHQNIVNGIINHCGSGNVFCNTQVNEFYYGCRIV